MELRFSNGWVVQMGSPLTANLVFFLAIDWCSSMAGPFGHRFLLSCNGSMFSITNLYSPVSIYDFIDGKTVMPHKIISW